MHLFDFWRNSESSNQNFVRLKNPNLKNKLCHSKKTCSYGVSGHNGVLALLSIEKFEIYKKLVKYDCIEAEQRIIFYWELRLEFLKTKLSLKHISRGQQKGSICTGYKPAESPFLWYVLLRALFSGSQESRYQCKYILSQGLKHPSLPHATSQLAQDTHRHFFRKNTT